MIISSHPSFFGPAPNKNATTLWDRIVKQNSYRENFACKSRGTSVISAYPTSLPSSKGNSTNACKPIRTNFPSEALPILAQNLCASVPSSPRERTTANHTFPSFQSLKRRFSSSGDTRIMVRLLDWLEKQERAYNKKKFIKPKISLDMLVPLTHHCIMNRLSREKQTQIIAALVEGNSLRATARMCDVAFNTVVNLLPRIGSACADYQDRIFRNLKSQADSMRRMLELLLCQAEECSGRQAR